MWAKLFFGCLLSASLIQAEVSNGQKQRSLFSYTETQNLGGQVRCLYDIVVLKDGTQLVGSITWPLPLSYPLGSADFQAENVHLLFSSSETPRQFDVLTVEGERLSGTLIKESLNFIEHISSGGKFLRPQARELQFDDISFILLKPRNRLSTDEVTHMEHPRGSSPPALFDSNIDLNIPHDIEITENSHRNLPIIGNNYTEKNIALGEDFDLVEWELESKKDGETKKESSSETEEFQFISRRLRTPEGGIEEIADLGSDEILPDQPTPVRSQNEETETSQDGSEQPDATLSAVKSVYDGMFYVSSKDSHSYGFYIKDRRVTNAEYRRFVEAVNYKPPGHWIQGKIPPGLEEKPVVNISYKDALLYAVWANKRLPTEEELTWISKDSRAVFSFQDNLYEWTSTPSGSHKLEIASEESFGKRMGREFHGGHEVFSLAESNSQNNDEANSYTGFRVVEASMR